jgi:hypothetical protein
MNVIDLEEVQSGRMWRRADALADTLMGIVRQERAGVAMLAVEKLISLMVQEMPIDAADCWITELRDWFIELHTPGGPAS